MARKKKPLRWSDPETDRFHAASRAEVSKLAAAGRGLGDLLDTARKMGADLTKASFRLISVHGVRFS